jgi:hypothetical protein
MKPSAHHTPARPAALAGLIAVLALTGCGTTVRPSQRQATEALAGPGQTDTLGSPTADVTGATPDPLALSAEGPAVASPVTRATGSGSVTPGTALPTASGQASTPAAVGAAAHTPITIGVASPDYTAVAGALGATFSQPLFSGYEHLFAALNRRGGLAGHPIKALYFKVNGASSSQDNEAANACSYFTEDHKVSAVLTFDYFRESFISCLGKKGIPQIELTDYGFDQQAMRSHPNYFLPDGMALDRYMATTIGVQAQLGLLTNRDVVGLLSTDCAQENRVYSRTVQPLAAKHGFGLVQATVSCGAGASDIASQIQAAVLKFRSNGVTQVLTMSAAEGIATVLFTKAASSQQYYPAYMLTSNAFPYANSDQSNAVGFAPDQLPKMRGVGWAPLFDLGDKAVPDRGQAAAQRVCKALDPTMADARSASSPTNQEQFFYGMCDTVLLLEKMVQRTAGNLSITALRQAYEAVMPGFAAAAVPGGKVLAGPGRLDGAALVAAFSFKKSCSCFTQDGGLRQAVS